MTVTRKSRKPQLAAAVEMETTPHQPSAADGRRTFMVAASVVAIGFVLRLAGMGSDLWLDELWSIQTATQVQSPLAVLSLHHEINHHLNTVWLYLVGNDAGPLLLRLPALIAGTLSVSVAGLIGGRRNAATGVFAMVLTAFSYELILYSSEARGYSTLILFSLLSFYSLVRYLDSPRILFAAGFGASALLAMLSHPTFAAVLAGAVLWSAVRLYRSTDGLAVAARRFSVIHAVPVLSLLALYAIDLRFVVAGGGTPTASLIDAYGVSLAWALGTPDSALLKLMCCIVAVVALDAALRGLRREGSDAWVFFAGVIVVFPIALIAIRGSSLVYTRHFLVGTTFLLILIAGLLGEWWSRGWKRVSVAAAAAFCLANGWHIVELGRYGRGQYQRAIAYMVENTAAQTVTIGGDHDFRIGFELWHYLPRGLGAKEGQYFEQASWPPGGPEWLVTHRESFEPTASVQNRLDGPGSQYELVRTFRTAPLSGLHWFVYHKRTAK